MPNQYESQKRTIGDMLSMTNPPIGVPEWQRNYSWKTTEAGILWLDLLSFSERYPGDNIATQEYFLGSVVLVLQPNYHYLLDGQQRIATATILLSVIRDFLKEYREDAASRISQRYISDYDDATDSHTYKLTLNRFDRDYFRQVVQEERHPDEYPEAEIQSHKNISDVRNYFTDQFQRKYSELNDGHIAFRWALRIQKVLTDHFSVVVVTSEDEDNAATVFETLNDRGIGLSAPDLLRNLLVRRATDEDREEILDCWYSVLEVAEDARVEDFLRHYWLSRQGDVKTRRLYREIKDYIESNTVDSLDFSRDLKRSSSKYRELVTSNHEDISISRLLKDVKDLGAKLLLPAIMSGYDVGKNEELMMLIRYLLVLYIRHNVIGNLENSKLESVIFKLASDLRNDRNFNTAFSKIREAAPSDERFSQQFASAIITRKKTARYLLREIEQKRRLTEELEVSTPDKVQIEHIYPQNPAEGRWPQHMTVINRLGNLTLLSRRFNQTITNSGFDAKKPYYEQSEILISKELEAYHAWTEEKIDQRQSGLAETAAHIWQFPSI